MARVPAKKSPAKAVKAQAKPQAKTSKVQAKAAPAKVVSKVAAKAPAKASIKAMAPEMSAHASHNSATCPCPCHEPIAASKYGKMCNCHLAALMGQKGTWAVWLITFAVLLCVGSVLMSLPTQPRPLLFILANHATTALAFALIFRLAFTGCGKLIEGLKLGMLVMLPLASLNVLIPLASIPAFIPIMATGLLIPVLKIGGLFLLTGAIAGALSGWLFKPASACCTK